MAQIARSVATLRIIGNDLEPDEVWTLLAYAPTHAQRRGDHIQTKGGVRMPTFGTWRLAATDKGPENVDSQISELFGKCTSDLGSRRSRADRFRVNLFCRWFSEQGNEGLSVSPSNLAALGERRIELEIDIYAPSVGA